MPRSPAPSPRRIFLLGATGTIGKAVLAELRARGHDVMCFGRHSGEHWRFGDVMDAASVARDGLRGEPFDAVISCMASRSGLPRDAWAIDHQAHINVLQASRDAGVKQFVLLSAICVQKPKLEFQHAKLAFEAELIKSGLNYSIVRPTAYFKSLSGQVARVKAGKPFLMFGNGALTACKPISNKDLAHFMVSCLDDPQLQNAILPIGGPGPAMTPRQQGELLFKVLGQPPKFRSVPLQLMNIIIGGCSLLGRVSPRFADKAEMAKIGRYYATESMLVWDTQNTRYDAALTPSHGTDHLEDYYRKLVSGEEKLDLGEHAVF
jgi:divinyl chlorophyllide a 8-vinyl-reductase